MMAVVSLQKYDDCGDFILLSLFIFSHFAVVLHRES